MDVAVCQSFALIDAFFPALVHDSENTTILPLSLVARDKNGWACLRVRVVTRAITANIETRAPTPPTHPTPPHGAFHGVACMWMHEHKWIACMCLLQLPCSQPSTNPNFPHHTSIHSMVPFGNLRWWIVKNWILKNWILKNWILKHTRTRAYAQQMSCHAHICMAQASCFFLERVDPPWRIKTLTMC